MPPLRQGRQTARRAYLERVSLNSVVSPGSPSAPVARPEKPLYERSGLGMFLGFIGVLTFSKISNGLLGAPLGLWWLWQRDWTRAALVAAAFVVSAGVLVGTNTAAARSAIA